MSKHVLQIILDSRGLALRSYAGRGMRHECLAITTDMQVGNLFADVLGGLSWQTGDDLADIAKAFRSMRSDSMGKSTIYYFPTVDYVSDDVDEDDSSDADNGDDDSA